MATAAAAAEAPATAAAATAAAVTALAGTALETTTTGSVHELSSYWELQTRSPQVGLVSSKMTELAAVAAAAASRN